MMDEPLYSLSHEAMKTVFQIRLIEDGSGIARQAALACAERIDAIEAALSRYLPGSDVWQINHLPAGASLFVGEDCEECLRLAMAAGVLTGGLFDVTLGRLIEHRKQAETTSPPVLTGRLQLDPRRPRVDCVEPGREIDLGGIGKGFALDTLARLCQEWGITSGLLSAGASTQLAFGPRSWEIQLRGDVNSRAVHLQNEALSASGTAVQGSHIVSPEPGAGGLRRERIWVKTASAAMADAFSTAALLAEDLGFLADSPFPVALFYEDAEGIQAVGC